MKTNLQSSLSTRNFHVKAGKHSKLRFFRSADGKSTKSVFRHSLAIVKWKRYFSSLQARNDERNYLSRSAKKLFPSKRSRKCAFDFHLEIAFRKLRSEGFSLAVSVERFHFRHSTGAIVYIQSECQFMLLVNKRKKARKSEQHHIFGRCGK